MKVDTVISEDEVALYDRQIRLWGVDAQKKLLSSRVLLVNMQGLGAEIAKNLVLSGINSLTLLDSTEVTENDFKFNFLLSHSSVGKTRAEASLDQLQILNPMVKVSAESGRVEEKDETFFTNKNFDLVCALIDDPKELNRINAICRSNNVRFISGFVHGLHGYMFVDLNDYQYIVEAPKITDDSEEKKKASGVACQPPAKKSKENEKLDLIEKNMKFESYATFLENYDKTLETTSSTKIKRLSKTYLLLMLLKHYYQTYNKSYPAVPSAEDKENMAKVKQTLCEKFNLTADDQSFEEFIATENFSEFCPVNAILGGVVAQECIKVITRKNDPIENLFVFDGNLMSGQTMKI